MKTYPVVREGSVEEAGNPQVNLFGISLQSEKTVERIKRRQQQMSKMPKESKQTTVRRRSVSGVS